ncbi:GlsB/YeaQ/YmgE family stress response membrane protein [Litorimonas sp. RW-G-Af-16]|uniref:GlsB/YeaQ/YmgE family stress response membrane protein n=1 Tax=Litorimonas sp. RW-G-Af-16 TaxID=3241168 RepID=UPI00390CC3ED
MEILTTILCGLVAGLIARFVIPGKTPPKGLIMTAVLGVAGALLASYAGQQMGVYQVGENAGLLGAVLGAIVVVFIYSRLQKR